MEIAVQFFVAGMATLAFAALFSAPRAELVICGANGAVGWIVYYLMTEGGQHKVLASLTASMILTFLARFFAVWRRKPVTMYLMPGIFPLVPGAGIYYTAYYLFTNDRVMGYYKGMETFEIAGAIVLGIMFGSVIPQGFFNWFRKR